MKHNGIMVESDHRHVNDDTGGKDVRHVVTTIEERITHEKMHVDVITDDLTCYEFSLNPGNGIPQFERRFGPDVRTSASRRVLPDVVESYLRKEFGGFN